jgi:GNAT superfamily N-acetyltransferase
MLDDRYELVPGVPSSDDYRRLRVAAGLSPKSAEAADAGLPNTIRGAMIHHDGRLVGMGRIVGDGGTAFLVVDIAVEPKHQGLGLGKAIVGSLVDYLHESAPAGAAISLFADGDARHLYAQFGFKPTGPDCIGMDLSKEKQR